MSSVSIKTSHKPLILVSWIRQIVGWVWKLFSWLLFRLLLAGIGLAFAALLLEIGLRFITLNPTHSKTWSDRPGAYFSHQNSLTLQELTHQSIKPKGVYRIAVVGDSFSFGPYMQFDDTFAQRMQRYLNLNESQPKVEVVNYGVPRYSTTHEIAVVERALSEGADLIILQITMNDPEIKPYVPDGTLAQIESGNRPDSSLLGRLKIYGLLESRLDTWRSHQQYQNYFLDLFRKWESFAPFKDAVIHISNLCREKNVSFAAVVFPLFGYTFDADYPLLELHHRLSDLLIEARVPFIDISSAYQNIPVERLQVLPGEDRHPNEIAHRIAAERLVLWLSEESIIPKSIRPKSIYEHRIGIIKKSEDLVKKSK